MLLVSGTSESLQKKSNIYRHFLASNGKKLSKKRKDEHCLANCRGCAVRYPTVLAFFPVKSRFLQGRCSKSNPVLQARNQAEKLKSPTIKPKQSDAKNQQKQYMMLYQHPLKIHLVPPLPKLVYKQEATRKTMKRRKSKERAIQKSKRKY